MSTTRFYPLITRAILAPSNLHPIDCVRVAINWRTGNAMFRMLVVPAMLMSVILFSSQRPAAAQSTSQWNTTLPFWQSIGSWSPLGVPGPMDTALFDINAIDTVTWNATTGNRSTGQLQVLAGDYTFNNVTATQFQLSLGSNVTNAFQVTGSAGTTMSLDGLRLNVLASQALIGTGATLNVGTGSGGAIGQIVIANSLDNRGTLNIFDGATVSNTICFLGEAPADSGMITVNGAGSQWTNSSNLEIGKLGSGILVVENGGVVTDANGILGSGLFSQGSATVIGAGSEWNHSGSLFVGKSGSGTLTVENGGLVSDSFAVIESGILSSSTAMVTGAGAMWNHSTSLEVGRLGSGILEVENGGMVTNSLGTIGTNPGSTGFVSVSGAGSLWNNTNELLVGSSGTGTLIVENGGMISSPIARIGTETGSMGFVSLTGAGSQWTSSSGIEVGRFGSGELVVANSSVVSGNVGVLGTQSGSFGIATVTGAGSRWNNNFDLDVGCLGSGILNIENGAIVTNSEFNIARLSGSDGVTMVSGPGSQLNCSGEFQVGQSGTGVLSVVDGGQVSSFSSSIGLGSDSTGTASVSGAGSQWNDLSAHIVGNAGTGTLNVLNGGTVSDMDSSIGRLADSTGTVTIEDVGSTWTGETMQVGRLGDGTLNIANGGQLSLGDTLAVGFGTTSSGNVNVFGADSQIEASILIIADEGEGILTVENEAIVSCEELTIGAQPGSNGLVSVSAEGQFQCSGSLHVGESGTGTLRVEPAGVVLVDGELSIASTSQLEMVSGSLQVAGGVDNNGLLELAANANIDANVVNTAIVNTIGGSDVLITGDLLHNGTAISTASSSRTRIAGTATGIGPYTGAGLVQFDGRLEPGILVGGQVLFSGNVALALDAALQIHLAGTATHLFDRLSINGSLTIESERTLEVALINGFAIAPGMQFVIAEVGTTRTGQFAGLSGGGLVGNFGGTDLFITYAGGDGNDIVLYTIGLLGDINGDGVVSLLDVAPFVNVLSSGVFVPEADINRDGVISLLDVSPFVALLTG